MTSLTHSSTSFLTIPPFNEWTISFEKKASLSFLILSYLTKDTDFPSIACTSAGWKDLCNLRAHMSFVHQAARPWRSVTASSTGNSKNSNGAVHLYADHYKHWSTKGYAWGAGSVRWNKLRELLVVPPPPERQVIRSRPGQLSLTEFYETFERLPGVPIIFMDLTKSWSSTPVSAVMKQTIASTTKALKDPVLLSDTTKEWSMRNFLSRFSTQWFRFDDLHGEEIRLLDYYIYTLITRDDSPLALYDSQFGEPRKEDKEKKEGEGEEEEEEEEEKLGNHTIGQMAKQKEPMTNLVSEYTVPLYFQDDMFSIVTSTDIDSVATNLGDNNHQRPPFRWILIGPSRSGTGLHIDPLLTSAWVTLLHGTKRWCMFPPDTPPESIGFTTHGPTKLEAVEWFDAYSKRIQSIKGAIEIVQQEGETVFVPAGWYHIVVNLTTTVSITHNYASPHGGPKGIQQIWREIVCNQPAFAQRWYRQILVLHLNYSTCSSSESNGSKRENSERAKAGENLRLTWVQSSNVVQHVQEAHVLLLKENRCDWNLEDCWDGLKLDDLFSAGKHDSRDSPSNQGNTIRDKDKVLKQVLLLEKNGEVVKVLLNKKDRIKLQQEEAGQEVKENKKEKEEKEEKEKEEKEEKEETKEANKGEEQRNRNNILHTNEGEETNNDGNNNDDSTTFMHLLYKVAFTSIVLLDGSNNVFLIKHRSGEWTPPGGKIEKNENSLEAAKREYQEETGVSIDALLSKGILESIGIFLFFHPESVRKSAKKERKQVSRKKKKTVRVRILCLVVFWVPFFGSRW
jgi:8-oxo-dGTP pyrophosphatase MutT (NUDIX family)